MHRLSPVRLRLAPPRDQRQRRQFRRLLARHVPIPRRLIARRPAQGRVLAPPCPSPPPHRARRRCRFPGHSPLRLRRWGWSQLRRTVLWWRKSNWRAWSAVIGGIGGGSLWRQASSSWLSGMAARERGLLDAVIAHGQREAHLAGERGALRASSRRRRNGRSRRRRRRGGRWRWRKGRRRRPARLAWSSSPPGRGAAGGGRPACGRRRARRPWCGGREDEGPVYGCALVPCGRPRAGAGRRRGGNRRGRRRAGRPNPGRRRRIWRGASDRWSGGRRAGAAARRGLPVARSASSQAWFWSAWRRVKGRWAMLSLAQIISYISMPRRGTELGPNMATVMPAVAADRMNAGSPPPHDLGPAELSV